MAIFDYVLRIAPAAAEIFQRPDQVPVKRQLVQVVDQLALAREFHHPVRPVEKPGHLRRRLVVLDRGNQFTKSFLALAGDHIVNVRVLFQDRRFVGRRIRPAHHNGQSAQRLLEPVAQPVHLVRFEIDRAQADEVRPKLLRLFQHLFDRKPEVSRIQDFHLVARPFFLKVRRDITQPKRDRRGNYD